MKNRDLSSHENLRSEGGFTLVSLLVSMVIAGLLFAAMMNEYSQSSKMALDHRVRVATSLQAQAMLQSIGSEIRVLGNGVPFEQANFQIGEDTLSDPLVTVPIETATATTSHISFRLNETGDVSLLTADFDPASTLTLSITDTSSFQAGDPIYLSNSPVSGDDGLYGVVASVNHGAKTITLAPGPVYSPSATFAMGSICEEVPLVIYDSPADGSGITRDSGYGPVLMSAHSTMSLEYLDQDGNTVALPLDNDKIVTQLRALRVTISHTSDTAMSTGQPYTATVSQVYGIRNLNYVY